MTTSSALALGAVGALAFGSVLGAERCRESRSRAAETPDEDPRGPGREKEPGNHEEGCPCEACESWRSFGG